MLVRSGVLFLHTLHKILLNLLKITEILILQKYWKKRFHWNLSGLLKETEILILLELYWNCNS